MSAGYRVKLRRITGLFIGLLFGVYGTTLVSEATTPGPESITLSPVSKHYRLDAGEAKRDELTIINDGTTPYGFTVYAKPYSVKDEDYQPDFVTVIKQTDVSSWITPEKTSYFLAPGESVKVAYTIQVPKDAAPGGHYGVIFAETQPSSATAGTSVQRKKRVGSIVYATVNGTYEVGGTLRSAITSMLQFTPPLKSEVTVENTGNTDFAVSTTHTVSDLFGRKKYSESKEHQVLPKTARKMPFEWRQAPSFGLYKVDTAVHFLDQHSTKTSFVLMAPIWAYLVFGFGLLAGALYAVRKRS